MANTYNLILNLFFQILNFHLSRSEVEFRRTSKYHCSELIRVNEDELSRQEFQRNGDTITQDDVVREQYTSLPYPEISQDEIIQTYNHYNGEFKHIPYMRPVAENLESLNHFLYEGRNNFRYVK